MYFAQCASFPFFLLCFSTPFASTLDAVAPSMRSLIHPEEVTEETVAQWLQGTTGNKDNPRGSRRIPPLDAANEPDKIYTEMYSMPNGEQDQEGEASRGESGDWKSNEEDEEESEDSSSGEEVNSPPRSERHSKQTRDPASAAKQPKVAPSKPRKALPRIKVDVPVASIAATSGTSMDIYKDEDDEETEDAATSKADDNEDMPQKPMGRRSRTLSRRVPASKRSCELGAQFADLEKKQIQVNLDMELAKENLQKARDETAEKMKQALEKKDLDLAAAQKAAEEKTALADKKLASVGKLEEENAKFKTALDEVNKEVTRMKKDKGTLTDKVEDLT
nr:nucleolin-like [Aegilops tauschii subsp. strangulata]